MIPARKCDEWRCCVPRRCAGAGATITSLKVTPLPVTGEASKHPPAADVMQVSAQDPAFYTGAVWMMAGGTWQVRFDIDGAAGHEQGSVPVVAVPLAVMTMDKGMGTVLGLLGLFLVLSMAGIVAASVGEARLLPGAALTSGMQRWRRIAAVASLILMALAVWGGAHWWNVEAAGYSEHIFKPAPTTAILMGNQLELQIEILSSAKTKRRWPSLLEAPTTICLDHGENLMHLCDPLSRRWM